MSSACGSDLPPRCSSSRHSSNEPESEPSGSMIGNSRSMPLPDLDTGISGEDSIASRARIQFLLPCTVLISPLCAT